MSTPLAPTLEAFFSDRLLRQKRVSPNTIASYRDTFRLLLIFVQQKTGTRPARLELTQLDATMIGAFLEHLETERGNSARTRNVRLGTIHSFFQYCALRHPEHAGQIARVLAIPAKRSERRMVTFLHPAEVKALLASPRPIHLGRKARPRAATHDSPDRAARLRGDRSHLRRRPARDRCTPPGVRQGTQGTSRPTHPADRRRAQGLDARARRSPSRPTVPDPHRRAADPRRRRTAARKTPPDRTAPVPDAAIEASVDAHASSHGRNDAAQRRRGHLNHRSVARPRAGADNAHLSPRRSRDQATRT